MKILGEDGLKVFNKDNKIILEVSKSDLHKIKPKDTVLQRTSLPEANLRCAYLCGWRLWECDFTNADMRYTNLQSANLQKADLTNADLRDSNLTKTALQHANLQGADLSGAMLYGAKLRKANIKGALLPHYQICPQEGSFTGYKKLKNGDVVTVEIPATAKRTSNLVNRECRAEYLKVLNDKPFVIVPRRYNPDPRMFGYTYGAKFFMTREEAEESKPDSENLEETSSDGGWMTWQSEVLYRQGWAEERTVKKFDAQPVDMGDERGVVRVFKTQTESGYEELYFCT